MHSIPDSFDCGNESLNEFIKSEEVKRFEEELLGCTTIIILDKSIVGYYTISNGSLRLSDFDQVKHDSVFGSLPIAEIPSILVGRLAIVKEKQKYGIGKFVIGEIVRYAFRCVDHCAVRLLVLHAERESAGFYRKMGFRDMPESRKEMRQAAATGRRTMYLDLKKIMDETDASRVREGQAVQRIRARFGRRPRIDFEGIPVVNL
jgi:GNAT superfamily N-acetyltransferase